VTQQGQPREQKKLFTYMKGAPLINQVKMIDNLIT